MNLSLPIRILLWPLSLAYGVVARLRVFLYVKGVWKSRRLKTPVISVGNLTVGGTGKTPMVLYLAEKFQAEGKRVGILSRGYRSEDGRSDEIEVLRQRLGNRVLFGVGSDRYEQGSKIEKENQVDLFLLDDGFQHLQLARDVDIVLWDDSKKFKQQWLLPSGSLREPISAIGRSDILVVSRKAAPSNAETLDSGETHAFYAQTKLLGFRKLGEKKELLETAQLGEGPFFAFCGIGNPEAFFRDLKRWQVEPVGKRGFRDHHQYSREDAALLMESAHWAGAAGFLTTEKDEQNLRGIDFGEWPIHIAVIELEVCPEKEFAAEIRRLLSERSGAHT